VAVASDRHDGEIRLRPRRALLWSGILVFIIVPLPIIATLVTLGVPTGSWPVALVGGAIRIILFVTVLYLFQTTSVVISATHFTERGFFSRPVTTPISEVSSVVIAHTFSTSSSETLPQLIVRNVSGERILRMRGIFWTEETMREAAAAIGTSLEEPSDPLTSHEFFEQYAGSAYWFENHRGLAIAAAMLIGLVCVGIVLGLMGVLGLPFGA
jgi:hypothetical protein